MGRLPTNGGPAFRFIQSEVAEMESILQEHHNQMPARELLLSLADKFSDSPERKGKIVVQFKQIWNWFQNRRYAIRAKSSKIPATSAPRDASNPMRNVPQPVAALMPPSMTAPMSAAMPATTVTGATRHMSDSYMELEAKSSRDGAWYDVGSFLAHRNLETSDPDVQVRFSGFGLEEDEWVNICKHIRQRSLPCEAFECVAVLPGDLILCFQEGKDQALYFDAHVLDAQRRRHDVRGCRCRFLVRYDHDQSEEIVPLRKICRRPETDYRLQKLHGSSNTNQQRTSTDPLTATTPAETMQKQQNPHVSRTAPVGVSHANVSSVAAEIANSE